MAKYTRKTKELDAFQWDGNNPGAPGNPGWFKSLTSDEKVKKRPDILIVKTAKGSAKVAVNDWVTVDDDGNVQVVSDAEFSQKYKVIP